MEVQANEQSNERLVGKRAPRAERHLVLICAFLNPAITLDLHTLIPFWNTGEGGSARLLQQVAFLAGQQAGCFTRRGRPARGSRVANLECEVRVGFT